LSNYRHMVESLRHFQYLLFYKYRSLCLVLEEGGDPMRTKTTTMQPVLSYPLCLVIEEGGDPLRMKRQLRTLFLS
jgi:hypothetical protein